MKADAGHLWGQWDRGRCVVEATSGISSELLVCNGDGWFNQWGQAGVYVDNDVYDTVICSDSREHVEVCTREKKKENQLK